MKSMNIKAMTATALMTAVLCVLGPVTLPVGPVPISLITLVLYFTAYILGPRESAIACLLYIIIGLVGVPVFSGYGAGFAKLFGPTGGYIIGYLPMVFLTAMFTKNHRNRRIPCIAVMIGATALLYLIGTAWLAYSTHITPSAAIAAGVLPFIPLDLCKIALAAIFAPVVHSRLMQTGLLPNFSDCKL